jgi:hypothetical protein
MAKDFQDWQKSAAENRRQRQALPLRQMPQEKPEICQNPSPLVLP